MTVVEELSCSKRCSKAGWIILISKHRRNRKHLLAGANPAKINPVLKKRLKIILYFFAEHYSNLDFKTVMVLSKLKLFFRR